MIDITRAQANQTTRNGVNEDWIVTLDEEEIYRLPAHFSVQETFMVRDAIKKMMGLAVDEVKKTYEQKVDQIIEVGDGTLAILKQENIRLATALEQHILLSEAA